jgi:sec-independent protein translocase protein TatA
MPQLGPVELILILVVFIMLFGAGKLGDLGGALGRGVREFKKNASLQAADDSPRRDTKKPGH